MKAAPQLLCRDCLTRFGIDSTRCPHCGSPRRLDLVAAAGLTLAHVDCDAFYASIEKRDRPELRDMPVIVGGAGKRGVVSTACYIARTFGVRSAMPMAEARQLCPDGVIVPPRMAEYSASGRRIREMMVALTPSVEPLSIDEAFLDLAGCEAVHGAAAAETLARFAARIEADVGVTISVGLSVNKFLAKLASDMEKPRGFTVLPRARVLQVLAPLDVGRIFGVGAVARARLAALGIERIGDLQRLSETEASRKLGNSGRRLWRLARGEDDRSVHAHRAAKNVSSEVTFENDISDFEELSRHLFAQAERLASRLRKDGLAARSLSLKLRRKNFQLLTRTRSLPTPIALAPHFVRLLKPVLRTLADGAAFRLLGVIAADLTPVKAESEATLFAKVDQREGDREAAINSIRERFGRGALVRGPLFKG